MELGQVYFCFIVNRHDRNKGNMLCELYPLLKSIFNLRKQIFFLLYLQSQFLTWKYRLKSTRSRSTQRRYQEKYHMQSFCLLLPIEWRQDYFCRIHVDNTHGVHTASQESILTFGFPRFGKISHILPAWLIFYLQPFPEVENDTFCFHSLLEVKLVVHGSNKLHPSWIKLLI